MSASQSLDSTLMAELLTRFVRQVPTSLAVKHAQRMVPLYKAIPSEPQTILDVGCGDGSFWRAFPGSEKHSLHGIDLDADETALAKASGVFVKLMQGDISNTVPEGSYDFVIGNCSMEHVPDIHGALTNIRACLKPDGRLLLLVPAFGWTRTLRMVRAVESRSTRLGMALAGAIDGFFQHHHLYDHDTWSSLLRKSGYRVVDCQGIGGAALNSSFERYLPPAALEFFYKVAFRHYPNWPWLRPAISAAARDELLQQPVPLGAPGIVEYIITAVPDPAPSSQHQPPGKAAGQEWPT